MSHLASDVQSRRKRCPRERGSSLIEFVLCFALFWVPFFMGLLEVGVNLIRAIQVTEVCRDAAHMSASVDFSDPGNQAILQKVAQGIDISSSGTGVITLSTITFVNDSDCQQAKLSNCKNTGQHVFTKRLVVGNSSVRPSAFGTPAAADMDANGNILPATYLTDPSCVATKFSPNLMTLAWGQYAYMAEMTVNSPDFSGWNTLGSTSSSARSIF